MGHDAHRSGSWHAWTDTEWRDEVAPPGEQLGRADQDLEAFLDDMGDMVRTVVECTVEPLRSFAETLPRSLGFEMERWHHGWRRPWRHAYGRR